MDKKNSFLFVILVFVIFASTETTFRTVAVQGTTSSAQPTPSPTYPPPAEWGYVVRVSLDMASAKGFVDVQDHIFTISKGSVGEVLLDVVSRWENFPAVSASGKFNVSFNQEHVSGLLGSGWTPEPLPQGVTITLEPENVTVTPQQRAQVKMRAVVDSSASATGKVEVLVFYSYIASDWSYETRTGFSFYLVIAEESGTAPPTTPPPPLPVDYTLYTIIGIIVVIVIAVTVAAVVLMREK